VVSGKRYLASKESKREREIFIFNTKFQTIAGKISPTAASEAMRLSRNWPHIQVGKLISQYSQ